jgi:diacylglycerol kinase family enzyme
MAESNGDPHIDIIATTISGSIRDWRKVDLISPLFARHGYRNVALYAVDSHAAARERAKECVGAGGRTIISAGGSGTFNSVLEGCCDSGVDTGEITLGFLRKGSADLIGKVLGMPDGIEEAIEVFAGALRERCTVKCDILLAESGEGGDAPRHFAGYAGAEIFGMIPTITESRFAKYYKGILSQFFGDLGPFAVGASLASLGKAVGSVFGRRMRWSVEADGKSEAPARYQAFIVVNGDLGKDLPLARGVPLGSGDFHMFALKDIGFHRLPGQLLHGLKGTLSDEPGRWGLEAHRIQRELKLKPETGRAFRANVDGATMKCQGAIRFSIAGQVNVIAAPGG